MKLFEIIRGQYRQAPAVIDRLCLWAMGLIGLWGCWQTYLETRPERMRHIQIMLPDPVVVLFMDSYIPIVLITVSLMALGRVHVPLALAAMCLAPLARIGLRVLDEIPGMTQPSPAATVVMIPLVVMIIMMMVRKRFRSLDAIAVTFSYGAITALYMLYHVAFIFPVFAETALERDAQVQRLTNLPVAMLAAEMEQMGARDVSRQTAEDVSYLNDMTDMNQEFTFPAESLGRIMAERPVAVHAWTVVGRTFADRRVILYDGRMQPDGVSPKAWALPQDFAQKQLIIVSGGFYLVVTIVAHFWTIMAVFICHIHGARVSRLQPFSSRRRGR